MPNTSVALRLARVLEASVEDLFSLPEEATRIEPAEVLAGHQSTGRAVQLCRVDDRLVASEPSPVPCWIPVGDGVVESTGLVRLFSGDSDFSGRLLIAGCDPGSSVLARHALAAGIEVVLAHRNSTQAMELLRKGSVHIAGSHLATGHPLPLDPELASVSFAVWEIGILAARGNPKAIGGVEDFARPDVAIVNREKGSGARALLDARLKQLGIRARSVRGYETGASGHLPAAWQVQAGLADCCIATGAAARAFGLDFIPLATERYDLAVRRTHLDLPRVRDLFEILSRPRFRRDLEGLGGYDTQTSGQKSPQS